MSLTALGAAAFVAARNGSRALAPSLVCSRSSSWGRPSGPRLLERSAPLPRPTALVRQRTPPPLMEPALRLLSTAHHLAEGARLDEEEDELADDSEIPVEDGDQASDEDTPPALQVALVGSVERALAQLAKKTASLRRELEKAQRLEVTMARANLILSNLYRLPPGVREAEVEDWEDGGAPVSLVLGPDHGSFQEEADALFARCKKMKRGASAVEDLLVESSAAEEILSDALEDLRSLSSTVGADGVALGLIRERLERSSKKTGFKPPKLDSEGTTESGDRQKSGNKNSRGGNKNGSKAAGANPREFRSPSGHRVLVGRNRRDNEAICFRLSRDTDIWMHSRGVPGAHCLLCSRRGSPEVTDDDLQYIADLAAFYSDARTETKAEITTASTKHIRKPKGAPLGAVTLREEGKSLFGRPGDVSDDLKQAREESGGQWDELGYRKDGVRSRNKKRTAAAEREGRARSREEARERSRRRQRKEAEQHDFY